MTAPAEQIAKGYQAREDGDLPLARLRYTEGAKLYREQGDWLSYGHAIRHIADIHQQEKNASEAKPLYEEALEIYRGNLETKLLDLANTVRPYALLNQGLGDLATAKHLWEEAQNLYASLRLADGVRECEKHIRECANSTFAK